MNATIETNATSRQSAAQAGQNSRVTRILYSGEYPELGTICAGVLAEAGYEVEIAGDRNAAPDAVRSGSYQLLVTSGEMSGEKSRQFTQWLRSLGGGIPVLALSSDVPGDVDAEWQSAQNVRRMDMPFTADQFLEKVRQILKNPAKAELPAISKSMMLEHRSWGNTANSHWGINE